MKKGFSLEDFSFLDMSCPKDAFNAMGATYRKGVGQKRSTGRTWEEATLKSLSAGKGPIVYRYVKSNFSPDLSYLDLGCGTAALHVAALRDLGFNGVIGYEWPRIASGRDVAEYNAAVREGLIDPDALDYQYDVVLLSNVVNVQPTPGCFMRLMKTAIWAMDEEGVLILNLPDTPRSMWGDGATGVVELDELLRWLFGSVDKKRGPIWICSDVYTGEKKESRIGTRAEKDFRFIP